MSEFDEGNAAIFEVAFNSGYVDHSWLNAFKCIRPTDEFAAEVGHMVIQKIMQAKDRQVVLTFNAS